LTGWARKNSSRGKRIIRSACGAVDRPDINPAVEGTLSIGDLPAEWREKMDVEQDEMRRPASAEVRIEFSLTAQVNVTDCGAQRDRPVAAGPSRQPAVRRAPASGGRPAGAVASAGLAGTASGRAAGAGGDAGCGCADRRDPL
jgi:hypothetical protein